MLETLKMAPDDRGVALLTRHSTRYSIPEGTAGKDVPLTPEGVRLAEEWGGQLGRTIRSIVSSPIGRCIETGNAMARGAGVEIEVSTDCRLMEPGGFVTDVRKAGPFFLEHGPLEMITRQLQQRPIPGVMLIAEGTKQIFEICFQSPPEPGEINICVTHDTLLACFIYFLVGKTSVGEDLWPWMLEGAVLWKEDDGFHWAWRGETGSASVFKKGDI